MAFRPPIVDDRGDLVVGRDLQEFGIELLVLGDVDLVDAVVQAAPLQQDRDLVPVGRAEGVKVEGHGIGFPAVSEVGEREGCLGGSPLRHWGERDRVRWDYG